MSIGKHNLDFEALAQQPSPEMLSELLEYCRQLEEQNAELSNALHEAQRTLQSFVHSSLLRDGSLLEHPVALDITLGEFLSLNDYAPLPQPTGEILLPTVPQHAAEWSTSTDSRFNSGALVSKNVQSIVTTTSQDSTSSPAVTTITDSAPHPTVVVSSADSASNIPVEPEPQIPTASSCANASLDSNADQTHNASRDSNALASECTHQESVATLAYPEAEFHVSSATNSEIPLHDASAVDSEPLADCAGTAETASSVTVTPEFVYQEWPDSPITVPFFGDERLRAQREELVKWFQDPTHQLNTQLFTTEQCDLFKELLEGSPNLDSLSSIICHDDNVFSELKQNRDRYANLWDSFNSYLQHLLREWSLDDSFFAGLENDSFETTATLYPEISQPATERIAEDREFTSAIRVLDDTIYNFTNVEFKGCESCTPISICDADNNATLVFNSDWCELTFAEKMALVNWEMHSTQCYKHDLRQALQKILSIEDTPVELGATLIKRTASVVIGKSNRNIPPLLMMEISGLWGSESLEELDDLLSRLHEKVNYDAFLYARELIASPQPLRQLYDLEADTTSLRLTNIVSTSRSIVAQLLGTSALLQNGQRGFQAVLSTPHRQLPYLHRRLAGLWVANLYTNS